MKTLTDKEEQILGSLARRSIPTDPLLVALGAGYVQELLRGPSKAGN